MSGFVYLIRNKDLYKIGITQNLEQRMKALKPDEILSTMKTENYEAAEPTPKDDETHSEYMSRCQEMGYSEEECMKAHEGHEFEVEGYHDDEKKKYASEKGDCGCGCKGGVVAYENWEEEEATAAWCGRSD